MLLTTNGVLDMLESAIDSDISFALRRARPIYQESAASLRHIPERSGLELQESKGNEPPDGEAVSLERLRIVVAELFKALSSTLQDERESAEECILRANAILRIAPSITPSAAAAATAENPPVKPIRGGLAPWQMRRVAAHIAISLDATISTKELASLVKLSSFHFCRAFRESFGDTPHGYVMRRRVERAQGLMLSTNTSLSQIAVDCGLADQAHFNKLFRRFVGESPGVWRRARAGAPA
jgi:AraC family transcriptional regulator